MAVEVRPAEPGELAAGLTPIFHYFGRTPTEDRLQGLAPVLPPERLHVAFDDGAAVGGAGAFPFDVTVPGGRVAGAGVTTVAVLPTHRRRGILRALMRAQLDAIHDRGEPFAYLWASEAPIYGRFGYGVASFAGEVDIPRSRAAFVPGVAAAGNVRLVSDDEASAAFPAIYERVAGGTPGMFARTGDWWRSRVLADPEWRRFGAGELVRAVLEVDGEPQAYALYRLAPGFEYGSSTGSTRVVEAIAATPEAMAGIWRFLLDVDWMDSVHASLLPTDHPLFLLLAEPRRARYTVGDALWVRLVDVGAALSARTFAGDHSVVLDVADEFCPWNGGCWEVGAAGVRRTEREPDLRLGVAALGSVYLGGFTFARLAAAGRLEVVANGGVERADALFYTDRAPWCPEIF